MRQRHGGPKIINWHRPLAPWKLKRKYLRFRDSYLPEDHLIDPDEYDDQLDHDWDVYDPVGPLDYAFYEALSRFSKGIDSGGLRNALKNAGLGQHSTQPVKKPNFNVLVKPLSNLEVRIYELLNYLLNEGQFTQHMRAVTADKEDMQVLYELARAEKRQNAHPYLLLLLFSPFWLRSPKSWQAEKKDRTKANLIKHLFERYSVPKSLESTWNIHTYDTRFKWIIFYILLAQGGSLKRAAVHFNWKIPKGFTQYFREAPVALSPIELAMFAVIRCEGGTIVEFERMIRQQDYVYDPTELADHFGEGDFDKFWIETIRWLSRKREFLADDEVDMILEWGMHQFRDYRWGVGPAFRWSGRTVERALEASLQYMQTRSTPWVQYHWEAHGWNWTYTDDEGTEWVFSELTSGTELYEEGEFMHNCVKDYASRCAVGKSAIVSLRSSMGPGLTIEIEPTSLKMVQALGILNQFPSDLEQKIIRLWHTTVVIKIDSDND